SSSILTYFFDIPSSSTSYTLSLHDALPILVHISSLCVGERNYPQYKIVHGAVLTSEGENDLECAITFQTGSILQKFMIRFERLRSEEHTSELQSRFDLVCRLVLEKKKITQI